MKNNLVVTLFSLIISTMNIALIISSQVIVELLEVSVLVWLQVLLAVSIISVCGDATVHVDMLN